MKAIAITSYGAPEVLQPTTRDDPVAGAGELLIRVAASGVNRPDVLQRKGLYPVPPGASDLPGLEVAGTIVDGDRAALAAAGFAIGDRVCALVAGGGYAESCVAPVGQCLPSPANLTDIEASSLPETFFTVWSNVFDRGRLQAGETLLVHGGSSGIGVTAIQMAKAWGAKVITTVGSADKAAACRALGADHAIDYKSQDFVAEVLRLTDGKGADVVLDMVAGDYLPKNLQLLRPDGRCVVIALLGGAKADISAALVMVNRLSLTGSTLRPQSIANKARMAKGLKEKVWPLLEAGTVRPIIYKTFALEDAASAHAELERADHVGKVMMTV